MLQNKMIYQGRASAYFVLSVFIYEPKMTVANNCGHFNSPIHFQLDNY